MSKNGVSNADRANWVVRVCREYVKTKRPEVYEQIVVAALKKFPSRESKRVHDPEIARTLSTLE